MIDNKGLSISHDHGSGDGGGDGGGGCHLSFGVFPKCFQGVRFTLTQTITFLCLLLETTYRHLRLL